MGSLTNYAEIALLKHFTKETAYSPAATLYLALCTGDPGEAATGASMSEVADANSYARIAIAFGAAASRRITQNATSTFAAASGSWGTISHWAIVDSATHGAGNALAYGALGASKTVISGNTPSVASGEVYIEITAANGLTNYFANGFLDRMFRNQAFTIAANYAAFSTTTPTDAGGNITEPGNGYAREVINVTGGASPAWGAVGASTVTNANAIAFDTPSGTWGAITHIVVYDAITTGNAMGWASTTTQTPGTGDSVSISSSGLVVTMS